MAPPASCSIMATSVAARCGTSSMTRDCRVCCTARAVGLGSGRWLVARASDLVALGPDYRIFAVRLRDGATRWIRETKSCARSCRGSVRDRRAAHPTHAPAALDERGEVHEVVPVAAPRDGGGNRPTPGHHDWASRSSATRDSIRTAPSWMKRTLLPTDAARGPPGDDRRSHLSHQEHACESGRALLDAVTATTGGRADADPHRGKAPVRRCPPAAVAKSSAINGCMCPANGTVPDARPAYGRR